MLTGILLVLLILAAGIVIVFVAIFNRLVEVKNTADKTWNDITIGLKQRVDELGKLLEVCKGYMKYEQDLLAKLTGLRTAILAETSVAGQTKLDGELSRALKSLFAVAENYPDLKANQNFMQLQQRISGIETKLADYRERYNAAANAQNILIQQIPYNFVAGSLGYGPREFFTAGPEDTKDIKISFS